MPQIHDVLSLLLVQRVQPPRLELRTVRTQDGYLAERRSSRRRPSGCAGTTVVRSSVRGLDRCYRPLDRFVEGLTESSTLKRNRGHSETSGEPEMEIDEPFRV